MDKEFLVFMLRNALKQEIDVFFDSILEHSVIKVTENTDPEILYHVVSAMAKKISHPILHGFMENLSSDHNEEEQDYEPDQDIADYTVN